MQKYYYCYQINCPYIRSSRLLARHQYPINNIVLCLIRRSAVAVEDSSWECNLLCSSRTGQVPAAGHILAPPFPHRFHMD